MRVGLLTFAIAVAAVTWSVADPAVAQERPVAGERGTGAFVDEEDNPTAVAVDANDVPGGGGSGGDSPCTWWVSIEDDFVFHIYETEGVTLHSATGRWFTRACERQAENGVMALDAAVLPEGGLVDPEALALQALESVTVPDPVIGTSPQAGSLVVHVPTWLWVEGDWWRGYEATARAGRVSSTVTADPVRAEWSMGDGSTVTCTGPGVEWAPGMPEDATDCSHTYASSSDAEPNGVFHLAVTVELEVGWSSNSGAGGTFTAIGRTTEQGVRVGEIQAIETE